MTALAQDLWADALKAARRSSIRKFKTGAAIYDRRGGLLSIGWSHLPSRGWTMTPYSTHAEHHAIQRLSKPTKKHAAKIVVVTISRKGNLTCSDPCPSCQAMIDRLGLDVIAS